jgi:hypothetical protein
MLSSLILLDMGLQSVGVIDIIIPQTCVNETVFSAGNEKSFAAQPDGDTASRKRSRKTAGRLTAADGRAII